LQSGIKKLEVTVPVNQLNPGRPSSCGSSWDNRDKEFKMTQISSDSEADELKVTVRKNENSKRTENTETLNAQN
jgi:hypothetical protein